MYKQVLIDLSPIQNNQLAVCFRSHKVKYSSPELQQPSYLPCSINTAFKMGCNQSKVQQQNAPHYFQLLQSAIKIVQYETQTASLLRRDLLIVLNDAKSSIQNIPKNDAISMNTGSGLSKLSTPTQSIKRDPTSCVRKRILHNMAPFCYLGSQVSQERALCCLISPVHALTVKINPRKCQQQVSLSVDNKIKKVPIKNIVVDSQISIITLIEPICEVGWVGLSISAQVPSRQLLLIRAYQNQFFEIGLKHFHPITENPCYAYSSEKPSTLFFQLGRNQLKLAGIQVSLDQAVFFNRQALAQIKALCQMEPKFERQFLGLVDIVRFQQQLVDFYDETISFKSRSRKKPIVG